MSTRDITVTGPFQAQRYETSLVHTDVIVKGHDRPEIEVTVQVQEEAPNDVKCWLEAGSIQCESQGDRPFDIRGLIVSLPRQVSLRVRTVSGDIRVEGLTGSPALRFQTVSGDVALNACRKIGEVSGHSVSGDVRLKDCAVERATMKTVSGDACLDASQVTELQFDSVSGEVKKQSGATVGSERARNISDLGAHIAKKVGRHVKIHVEKSSRES